MKVQINETIIQTGGGPVDMIPEFDTWWSVGIADVDGVGRKIACKDPHHVFAVGEVVEIDGEHFYFAD